jgi:GT2 family glycosyltransferase
MKTVTLVITTHNRTDLLEKTLISFFKYNTYPIKKVVIVEDSGILQNFNNIKKIVSIPLELIINETNIGQIASIDKAYACVETDYIFHCEEDWEFYNSGFIEKSFEILDNDPKTFTVWLRSHSDTKNHAILKDTQYSLPNSDFYYRMNPNHKGVWCGFTFNPGLRRTSDCMIFYPYNNLDVKVVKNRLNLMGEVDLSIYYKDIGFYGSITSKEEGYVRHIGGKRHVPLPWQKL